MILFVFRGGAHKVRDGARINDKPAPHLLFALDLPESARMKVVRLYPGAVLKPATRTVVVPAPGTNRMGGAALSGEEVVRWAEVLLQVVVEGDAAYETEATTYRKRR